MSKTDPHPLMRNFDSSPEAILKSAKAAYGHVEGATDVEMLCLRISQITRLHREAVALADAHAQKCRALAAERDMTALDLLAIIRPDHDRSSCSDQDRSNSFFTRDGVNWYGRCTRCMWLDLADGVAPPDGFDPEDSFG